MFTEGEFSVERYLKAKKKIDAPLPEGADQALSFPDFATYATAIARRGAAEYYTPELAERVFRAYEEDFNLLGYSRALPA